jgi:hypothetical protein
MTSHFQRRATTSRAKIRAEIVNESLTRDTSAYFTTIGTDKVLPASSVMRAVHEPGARGRTE